MNAPQPVGKEDRLNQILLGYLEAVQSGQNPDREELLARHAEFAAELTEFFSCRDQVDRFVAPLHATATDLLDMEPAPAPPGQGPAEPVPEAEPLDPLLGQLGDFHLVREIGRGGMGVVYEAEQISLRRRVALKILPFAAAFDPKQLQRFKNEALAAAHLNHPNIVPVYAVGSERGVHYYAMQFIDGQSLAALIAEVRHAMASEKGDRGSARPAPEAAASEEPTEAFNSVRPVQVGSKTGGSANTSPSSPSGSITVDNTTQWAANSTRYFQHVCRLGIKAAQALDHAHQMGVVHRDIKPANLLVDLRGNLWVTDFGLALFQRDLGLTLSGELLGTLRYTSPESALAKRELMDHRTDIYSLGVTLYEMLTLQPVFDGHDRQQLMHQIAFDEPRSPRTVRKSIPVELETVMLKAIAKNPAERYATAQDLAEDLQRFLDCRPVLARRPTVAEKAFKWSRRHRAFVAMAMLLVVVTITGLGVSTVLIARKEAQTKSALDRERAGFQQARRAIDFITQINDNELAGKPGMQRIRKKLLEAAVVYYRGFVEQYRDDPAMQTELARSRLRLGRILAEVHADIDALAELEDARVMQEKLIGENSSDRRAATRLSFINYHLFALQGCAPMALLADKAVQDDIQMTAAQRERVEEFARRLAEQRRVLIQDRPALSADGQHAKLEALTAGNEKTALDIVTPAQRDRLRQIALQVQGMYAFADPQVEEKLQLTKAEKEKIAEEQADAYAGLWDQSGSQDTSRLESIRKTAQVKILKQLTPQQIAKWNEITGVPFHEDVYFGNRRITIHDDAPKPAP